MGERGVIPKPKAATTKKRVAKPKNPDIPAAPEDLPEGLLPTWETFWTSIAGSLLQDADMGMVKRLFGLYAQYEKSADVVKQALVVKGSMGQLRVNPLADHMLKLENAILRLENELGLTPMARARLGITAGNNADQDNFIDELAQKREASYGA